MTKNLRPVTKLMQSNDFEMLFVVVNFNEGFSFSCEQYLRILFIQDTLKKI